MSRLGEIYKAQKAKGGTVTGALGSTLKERAKEKFDPRNLIDQQGILASMFPSLKAYRSKTDIPKQKTPIPKTKSSIREPATDTASDKNPSFAISDSLSDSIKATRVNSEITAKNTMSIPAMARDMNVVRQGIIKLVKASGSEQRNKADAFFRKSGEEETAYESKFGKLFGKKDEKSGDKEKEKDKGFFGTLISSLLSSLGELLSTILLVKFLPKLAALLGLGGAAGGIPNIPGRGRGKAPTRRMGTGRLALLGLGTAALGYGALKMADGSDGDAAGQPGVSPTSEEKRSRGEAAVDATVAGVGAAASAYGAAQNLGNITAKGSEASGIKGLDSKSNKIRGTDGRFKSVKDLPKGEMLQKFVDFVKKAASKKWIPKVVSKLGVRLGTSIAVKAGLFLSGLAAAPLTAGISLVVAGINLALLGYDAYLIYDAIFGPDGILQELEEEDTKKVQTPKPSQEAKQTKPEPAKPPEQTSTTKAGEDVGYADATPAMPTTAPQYKPATATPSSGVAPVNAPAPQASNIPQSPTPGFTPVTPPTVGASSPSTGAAPATSAGASTQPSRSATPGESLYSIGGGKAISSSDVQKVISAHEGNADSVYGDYTNRSTKKLENKYGLRPPEWAAANLGQAKPLSEFTFEELRNYQMQRPTSTGAAGIAGFMPSTIFGRDMSGSMAGGGMFAKSGLSWKDKFSKENQQKLQQVMSAEQDAVLMRGLKKLGINEITPGMKLAANYVGPAGLLWTIEEGQKDPNISVKDAIMKHSGRDPTKGPNGSTINADLATTKASQFVQAKEQFANQQIAKMGIQTVDIGTGGQQPSLAQAAAASPPVSASPTPSAGGASGSTPSTPSPSSPTPTGGAASTPSPTSPAPSSGAPVMTGAGVPLTSGATGAPVTTTTPSAGGAAGTAPPPPATSATPAASGTGKKTTEAKGVEGGLVSLQTKSGRSVQVAEKYAGNFQGFINDLEALGYQIRAIGGYAYRQNVNDPTKLSVHSRGMAIDINDKQNPNKSTQTDLPPETAQLAKKWGLGWGMNWKSVKDPMHFSAAKEEGGSESPKPLGAATSGETKKEDDKLKPTDSEHASKGGGSPAISPSAAPSGAAATTPATSSSGGGGSPVMTGAGTPLTSGATGAPVTTTPPSPAPAVTSTPAPMSSAPSTGQKLTQMNAEVSTAKEEKQNIVVQQPPPAVIQQPQQRQQPVASTDPGKPASVFDKDVMEALFKRQGPSFSLV